MPYSTTLFKKKILAVLCLFKKTEQKSDVAWCLYHTVPILSVFVDIKLSFD